MKRNPEKVTERSAMRRKSLKLATPKWLTKEHKREIATFYLSAKARTVFHEEPHHVDHIEPIKGVNKKREWVSCGLHVGWNLRVIPGVENLKKSNKLLNITD